jgi:hypothetical protein
MNNDERDFAEEAANRRIFETGDGELQDKVDHLIARGREIIDAPYNETEVKAAALLGHPARTFPYYFTFGVGHRLIASLPESPGRIDPRAQQGIELAGMYVKIEATDEISAREEMIRRFSIYWSTVYDEKRFEIACAKYRYIELKLTVEEERCERN